MKQIELAKELGISKSYLSMILSGKRTPNSQLAGRLSSLNVHKTKLNDAWKAGTLPTELLPHIMSTTPSSPGQRPLILHCYYYNHWREGNQ